LEALQWVRQNVAAFGGDPSRVTVLGHDTGAALVNLLLISSAAKGNVRSHHMDVSSALRPRNPWRNTHKHSTHIKHRGRIINTPASYTGSPEFEYLL
jgi:carboxylesterase type B